MRFSPESASSEAREAENKARVDGVRQELASFAQDHGLRGLDDRVKRGLDPVGIMAVAETRRPVESLAAKEGGRYEDVLKMTLDIQTGGPWAYAAKLKEAKDPDAKVWMMMNAANTLGKEREMDLTEAEFAADLDRVRGNLAEAESDPEKFFDKARQHVLEESQKRFRVVDGVPISEMDNGFIAMAVNGYEAGIIQDADGMLFVGAKQIDDEVFRKWGLRSELREDRGRRDVEFYVNGKGEALIKKLYPGFAVVLSRNFDLARAVARASDKSRPLGPDESVDPPAEALSHTLFEPTSQKGMKSGEVKEDPMTFLRSKPAGPSAGPESSETALVRLKDLFYDEMAFTKSQVIFLDALENLRRERAKKGKQLSEKDFEKTAEKTDRKVRQKMDELRYMIDSMSPYLDELPDEPLTVMDMAGGAGDLGLAVSTKLLAEGRKLKETRIVDPFSRLHQLDVFTDTITDHLPFRDELKNKVVHTYETVQEAEPSPDSVVVAKHACGTLSDDIIEKWVDSESPLLVIMTCCHDKAIDQPARYNLSQEEWKGLCSASAATNDPSEKNWKRGMEAMTQLDNARVEYLRRRGFDADLVQTDKFPKGDVIIARRKKK